MFYVAVYAVIGVLGSVVMITSDIVQYWGSYRYVPSSTLCARS